LKPVRELKIKTAGATPGDSSNFLTQPPDALPIGPKLRYRDRRPLRKSLGQPRRPTGSGRSGFPM